MTKQSITGIGAVMFRAKDPAALTKWYDDNLGITAMSAANPEPWHQEAGPTVFSPADADTDYFPAHQQFLLNFRVSDLDAMLEQLGASGVKIDDKRVNEDYGRFAWVYDPEGNKIELWQPLD
ncbi:MAG TPA: VOC family protein [Candidatus Saccharimonadia bacterium]|nr:VOC family protein [Candidatus Saccharimonadia bacterium]